jgi:hypothetical protein
MITRSRIMLFPTNEARRRLGYTVLAVGFIVLALFVMVPQELGLAQDRAISAEERETEAAALTHALLQLNLKHQLASPSERARLHDELLTLARNRHQDLAALIEKNPKAVLRLAIPADSRATLPPEVQALVEQEVTEEGELEVLHEDRDPGSRYLYFLKTGAERFSLHFAAHPPTHLTGTRVRVTGVRVNHDLALESGKASVK